MSDSKSLRSIIVITVLISTVLTSCVTYLLLNSQIIKDLYRGPQGEKGVTGAQGPQGPSASLPIGSTVTEATYIIYKNEGKVYARNGKTGINEIEDFDASKVINEALNSLTPGRLWKEKIVVKGDLVIRNTIFLPEYTIIDLSESRLTLGDNSNKNMFEVKNKYPSWMNVQIEIRGGILDGNKNHNSKGSGLYLEKIANSIVSGVWIQRFAGYGMKTIQSNQNFYSDLYSLFNNYAAIDLDDTDSFLIDSQAGNMLSETPTPRDHTFITRGTCMQITNLHAWGPARSASPSAPLIKTGELPYDAVHVLGYMTRFTNLEAENAGRYAIYVNSWENLFSDVWARQTEFNHGGLGGIYLDTGSGGNHFSNLHVDNNKGNGITVLSASNSFVGGSVSRNAKHGIYVEYGAYQSNTFDDLDIRGNCLDDETTYSGIYMYNAMNVKITNCRFWGYCNESYPNIQSNSLVESGASNYNLISGNTFDGYTRIIGSKDVVVNNIKYP